MPEQPWDDPRNCLRPSSSKLATAPELLTWPPEHFPSSGYSSGSLRVYGGLTCCEEAWGLFMDNSWHSPGREERRDRRDPIPRLLPSRARRPPVYDASSRYFHYPLRTHKLRAGPGLGRENPSWETFRGLSGEFSSGHPGRSRRSGLEGVGACRGSGAPAPQLKILGLRGKRVLKWVFQRILSKIPRPRLGLHSRPGDVTRRGKGSGSGLGLEILWISGNTRGCPADPTEPRGWDRERAEEDFWGG